MARFGRLFYDDLIVGRLFKLWESSSLGLFAWMLLIPVVSESEQDRFHGAETVWHPSGAHEGFRGTVGRNLPLPLRGRWDRTIGGVPTFCERM